jgi:hypothetical protein
MSDVSDWWQIDPPEGVIEWCEKNVEEACEYLAKSCKVSLDDGADTLVVHIFCGLWEQDIGDVVSLESIVSRYVEEHVGGSPENRRLTKEAHDTLVAFRKSLDAMIARYPVEGG